MARQGYGSLLLMLVAGGCADPRMPTGGLPDRTPPELEMSIPAHETTLFSGQSVRLVFSEYVDQASFVRALSITPEPEGRFRYRWRNRRVDIRFSEPLREHTTYILTLDNNLRDERGVSRRSPITVAFSTGDVIDPGRMGGYVREAGRGAGMPGMDVFLYALPDSTPPDTLPERPDYRTQTDETGRFSFSHLREAHYFVFALRDQNRSGGPDANELFAVAPRETLPALPDTTVERHPWVVTLRDTLRPAVQRVRPLSNSRLQVRFTEAIALVQREPEAWVLQDSISAKRIAIRAIYQVVDSPRELFLRTDTLAERTYSIRPDEALIDSSGNAVVLDPVYFTARAVADTAQLRFRTFLPKSGEITPRTRMGVVFSEPPNSLKDIVSARDTTGQLLEVSAMTEKGTTYFLTVAPATEVIDVQVQGIREDTVYVQRFRNLAGRDLGSLSGAISSQDSVAHFVIELYNAEEGTVPYATLLAHPPTLFSFADIPEGSYFFRVFADRNGNGRWDGGQILPYEAAEPVTWSVTPVTARPRWDVALSDTVYVPTW